MGLLNKIVKNDAMKTDPPEIYGWRVWVLAVAGGFGGMLFGWDVGAIGGIMVMPQFIKTFGLPHTESAADKKAVANTVSNVVSILQAGCFLGALAAFYTADKWGRRPSLMCAATFAIIGIAVQAGSSGEIAALYVGRFIAGIGVGSASMLTPLYVSENAPRSIRGGMTGIYQLNVTLGIMLSFWVNYGSLEHSKGDAIWQVPLALQMLPAACLLIGVALCNESPRFLAKQDNWERATAVLTTLRNLPADHPYLKMELDDMHEQLDTERRLIGGASFMDLQREMWLVPVNRKRALISIGLMICQQMTGTNAINYYAPQIFKNLGIVGPSTGLFATGIYGIVKVCACSVFLIFVADSLGRRYSLLWTSIAQSSCMFLIGTYVLTQPPKAGTPISPYGYVSLVCIFLFAAIFQFGWGPVCWILVSEIPTARLRAMNVAIAAAVQWLFNFVVAQAVPRMLVNVGAHGFGTYYIFGSFCFSMFFFVWFFIPETKGVSLEKMDALFGAVESAKYDEEDTAPSTRDDKQQIHETTEDAFADHKQQSYFGLK
ncbi:probable MFS quinate transporter [Rhynchosporium secalis]|uniref:Probable MFS quinate transporter n=1 Tax=Rhynchosporium secalis TaxID=38038 RepID=A0A1E1MS21_RHYSE|nr:probable MFS quinate transporter [Rhynchosporium secalis]